MPRIKIAGILVFLAILACTACGDSTPSTPSETQTVNVTGRWRGDITFAGAAATMQWTLTQTGTSVGGEVLLLLPSGTVLLNGVLTGTLNGTTLPVTIAVGPGGVPNKPNCTGTIGSTMHYNAGDVPTMNGTLSITQSSCQIDLAASTPLTLTKQ